MSDKENKPNFRKPEWWLEKFTPSIVGIIVLVINNMVSKSDSTTLYVSIAIYSIAVFAAMVTSYCVTNHYNKKHNNPKVCQAAISENCRRVANLCEKYDHSIEIINSKVSEQEKHISDVNELIKNAKDLEKLYAAAVAKRLRTNKQVTEIESKAKANSEIFIMTSSFLFERFDDDMRLSIAKNIAKGVKYRYIIPQQKENEFKQMVYAVMAEIQDNAAFPDKSILNGSFDCIKAVQIPRQNIMLTIAYYELNSSEISSVIVKLPADTLEEINEQEALAYLVPTGTVIGKGNSKYYSEHRTFYDCMSGIYQSEKANVMVFNKSKLIEDFPNGVEIANSKTVYLK